MHDSHLHNAAQQITNQMFINAQTWTGNPQPGQATYQIHIHIVLHFANTLRWPLLINYGKTTQSKCKLSNLATTKKIRVKCTKI